MRWQTWFRRTWERRMDSELRFHLDNLTRDYMSHGMSREDAERRARQEFGPIELTKDECRDGRALVWFEDACRDLRLAVRSLRRAPGFALAVVLTLALGIGANTSIFSAVHAVLLKPLPYSDPDRLYTVEIVIPELLETFGTLTGRIQDYLEWRDADTVFADVGAMSPARWTLTGSAEPEGLFGARVSANYFSLLGIAPTYGRGFSLDEEQPGQDRVVVISDGLWRRRYGADPTLVGQDIDLDGQPLRVVGIASPTLMVPTGQVRYLSFGDRIDIWRPAAPTAADCS